MIQRLILSAFLFCFVFALFLLVPIHVWEDEDQNSGLVNLCLFCFFNSVLIALREKDNFFLNMPYFSLCKFTLLMGGEQLAIPIRAL